MWVQNLNKYVIKIDEKKNRNTQEKQVYNVLIFIIY